MSVIHLNQIAKKLNDLFDQSIPKDDLSLSDTEIQNKVISRQLAAYAIFSQSGCEVVDAALSVTDGSDDNGIDAVYYSAANQSLYIVQAKWIHSGTGEPSSDEIIKYCKGVRDLVNLKFDRFNARLNEKGLILRAALESFNCKVVLILAFTGNAPTLAKHGRAIIDDLLSELNDSSEIASLKLINQAGIYALIADGMSGDPIDVEFSLTDWGKVNEPYTAFYGNITGDQIAEWRKFGERLFARNLRGFLGRTDVNSDIEATISERPEDFWYFNNGITVVAKKLEKSTAGGSGKDFGAFRAKDASVVNGAQTVSTIGKFSGDPERLKQVVIQIRFISLDGAPQDYGSDITRTNNTQNRIEARDFVAQDPEQKRLQQELFIDGIEYFVSRTQSFRPGPKAFDLFEATAALACASDDHSLAVYLKREAGVFWYDLTRAPYKTIFNAKLDAHEMYHKVLLLREIEGIIEEEMTLSAKSQGVKYGVLIHGNRMIQFMTMQRLKLAKNLNTLDKVDIRSAVNQAIDDLCGAIEKQYPDCLLATLFKNTTKCGSLINHKGATKKEFQASLLD